MQVTRHRRLLGGCAMAATALVVAGRSLALGGDGSGRALPDVVEAGRGAGVRIVISADAVRPVSPGTSARIDLTFTNEHDAYVVVRHVSVTVKAVSAPHRDEQHPCGIADFTAVQPVAMPPVVVPPHSVRALSDLGIRQIAWPLVAMLDTRLNQDGCKGAVVSLGYTSSARRAR